MLASVRTMPADRFATRVFGLAVLALLAYALFLIFRPFYGPMVWAFLIAFLLFPLVRRVRSAVSGRNGVAATLVTLAVIVGLVLPTVVVVAAFGGQAVELGQRLTAVAQQYQIRGAEDLTQIPVFGEAVKWVDERIPASAAEIQAWLIGTLQSVLHFVVSHSGTFVVGAFGVFGSLSLMLFVLFFFLRDGDAMVVRAIRLIPMDPKKKERLVRHLGDVTRAVVFGTLVTALVQGFLIGIAFWITGLSSPVVFGGLAFIASFIPFVGTALVVAPACLYLLAQGVVWKTVFMLVWGVVVAGSADNVLRPALVSGRAQIGTLTAFFGVIGGIAAFGMVGLFLGPVFLALVLALIEFVEEDRALQAAAPAPPAPTA
jgi:predicted PurR-regulated permease PerM